MRPQDEILHEYNKAIAEKTDQMIMDILNGDCYYPNPFEIESTKDTRPTSATYLTFRDIPGMFLKFSDEIDSIQ